MKKIFYILLLVTFVFFISCYKEKPNVEKIIINGTVSDINNNLLDSVEITLYKDFMMSMGAPRIDLKYSKEGKFKFEFTTGSDILYYYLCFEKEGFEKEKYSINRTKGVQKCNIIMESNGK